MPPLTMTKTLLARPWLRRVMRPIAAKYLDLAGYRQVGLVADDLIVEENDIVQEAIKRLPPKVVYDRMFRMRRAVQCSITHTVLPLEEQTKPEQDINYLSPYIEEIEIEIAEKYEFDSMTKAKWEEKEKTDYT